MRSHRSWHFPRIPRRKLLPFDREIKGGCLCHNAAILAKLRIAPIYITIQASRAYLMAAMPRVPDSYAISSLLFIEHSFFLFDYNAVSVTRQ